MKKQNHFSTPQPHSKRVQLFNPNAAKVDQILSRLKSILTTFRMPSSFDEAISNAFSKLHSNIPKSDITSKGQETPKTEFDTFWIEWINFRDEIIKQTDPSVILFCQMFVNEKFDQFNEIIEDLNLKPPQKVPLYREYDKAKKDIQTTFENLQQILYEQFDIEDENNESSNSIIEQTIKNLSSQRTKIRRIKADVASKLTPFFLNSSQEKNLAEEQHKRCVTIIEEILSEINDLPKQYHQFNMIGNELYKSENKLKMEFPPRKIEIPPMEGYFEEEEYFEEDIIEEEEEIEGENDLIEEGEFDNIQNLNKRQQTSQQVQPQSQINNKSRHSNNLSMTPQKSFKNSSEQLHNQTSNQSQNSSHFPAHSLTPQNNSNKAPLNSSQTQNSNQSQIQNHFHNVQQQSITPQKNSKNFDDQLLYLPSNFNNNNLNQNELNSSQISSPKRSHKSMTPQKPPKIPIGNPHALLTPSQLSIFDEEDDNLENNSNNDLNNYPNHNNNDNNINVNSKAKTPANNKNKEKNILNTSLNIAKNQQNLVVKNPPQSAVSIKKLPQIMPLDLEDDVDLADPFHGLSISFSSSDNEAEIGMADKEIRTFQSLPPPLPTPTNNTITQQNGLNTNSNSNLPLNPHSNVLNTFNGINSNNEKSIRQEGGGQILRNQIAALTKEKEQLKNQLTNTKSDLAQLHDDYNTIVVQLQIAYEENKENDEATSKLNETVKTLTKEKEQLNAKIRDLQQVLLQTPSKVDISSPPEKLLKLDSGSDDDDDNENDNFVDVSLYQTKCDNLVREKDALYENISKLADENANLKEQLMKQQNNNSNSNNSGKTNVNGTPGMENYYAGQVRLLEEDIEYFTDELTRVWKTYDALLNRIGGKSKDDSVFFENSKLRKEKEKLHTKLQATRKELQFLKDIRKSQENSKSRNIFANELEETKKKLEEEKRKNEALVKALREERQKIAASIEDEDEHRQLFTAKLSIHNLQRELQKMSSLIVRVKGKNKRLKMQLSDAGIDQIRDEMNDELEAMRSAYESAVDWGYAQQELVIKESSEKEMLKTKLRLFDSKNDSNPGFDAAEEVLIELRAKIEENLKMQQEAAEIRESLVEVLGEGDENVSTGELLNRFIEIHQNENQT
ncbi:hypothetical protein TRFO_33016 [Tritrichomonas foetus]|uniref:Uncharacterized protein n=1 Tax=Tritrichomonas foetus TaxID=1144522 RepID=A0A1J4JMR5_9EUKA|nr:hypothetical protein TRFO_33016 [Tritrichomonas foetus]|eukprot:OHT00363.1 hypothetical protein TRFO_33016 [Tritrichomonas foetus]